MVDLDVAAPRVERLVVPALLVGTVQAEVVGAVLRAADMDFAHVAQVTLFLRDMDDYAVVNEVYARYFSGATPAREALEVGKLPREARVEISCIAVR